MKAIGTTPAKVIDEGRIVERGSHEELVAHGGIYAELFALQAASYG